jgi:hypothetical protein
MSSKSEQNFHGCAVLPFDGLSCHLRVLLRVQTRIYEHTQQKCLGSYTVPSDAPYNRAYNPALWSTESRSNLRNKAYAHDFVISNLLTD